MDDGGKGGLNLLIMTPLQLAQKEWEDKTIPHPKNHLVGKKIHIHEFRKFGEAIAWLQWDGKYIVISKFEKLPGAARGAGTRLVRFLISLADKYQLRIFGNLRCYEPDPPIPCGSLMTQDVLESWYKKQGFKINKNAKSGVIELWYPSAP